MRAGHFDKLFNNNQNGKQYRSVVDFPASVYYKELLQAYPDAKVRFLCHFVCRIQVHGARQSAQDSRSVSSECMLSIPSAWHLGLCATLCGTRTLSVLARQVIQAWCYPSAALPCAAALAQGRACACVCARFAYREVGTASGT